MIRPFTIARTVNFLASHAYQPKLWLNNYSETELFYRQIAYYSLV